jgi:hypothetical protein
MKKKVEKHPKNMTTEEAAKHLFHPKLIEHVKKNAGKKTK